MTALLAYCDPISVAAGERVRVMVSCIGAARYEAELVRLINPQAGPLATPFRTERDRASGQPQLSRAAGSRIPIGSFGVVDAHPLIAGLRSFTLQAYVWPTTPGSRPAGSARHLVGGRAAGLRARPRRAGRARAPARRRPRGREPEHRGAAAGAPLVPGRRQLRCRERPPRPLAGAGRRSDLSRPGAGARRGDHRRPPRAALRGPSCSRPGTRARRRRRPPTGRLVAGGHYNGKLDRPRLANRALAPAEVWALAGDGALPAGLEQALVARWDFSHAIADRDPGRQPRPTGCTAPRSTCRRAP